MIKTILANAGIPARPSRYTDPPGSTYAVYFDDVDTHGGPDIVPGAPLLVDHSATIELYESVQDDVSEAALESAITAQGLPWTKQARYWLQNAQRYQVIYEFEFTEKRRA
jgi:hypothetical protein